MDANVVIPNFDWYVGISGKHGTSPRCPFASVERCPRYYQSLSLLGSVGFTGIEPKEDEELLRRWTRSDLWSRTKEQSSTIMGGTNAQGEFTSPLFLNFCPEVTYDGFGLFASSMSRYADEIDSDFAHARLAKLKAPITDWRWQWWHVRPMHYSECPLYSVLAHGQGSSPRIPMIESQRRYLEGKLTNIADDAIEDSLKAVSIAQGEVTLAGQLGNSRAYLIYNAAVFEIMKTTLPRMARIVFHVSGGHTDEAATILDSAATAMVNGIIASLEKRFQQAALAFGERPLIDQLGVRLTREKDQVVDDFKHGMDGEVPLTKQPTGNVYNVTQTNSPAGQIAVGDHNAQSIQQQSAPFLEAMNELLSSDRFKKMESDQADVVRTLADLVRTELQKPNPDVPKIKSWGERISQIVQAAGLAVEAAKIAAALAGWWLG